MKIGIDASRAFLKNRTGIEEYSYQVINNLKNELYSHQVVLYVRKDQRTKIKEQNDDSRLKENEILIPNNWSVKEIKWPRFWTQAGLSLEMLLRPVDVLFIPAHTVPIIHPKNTCVVIHGLEYEFCPEAYSFWERIYMRWTIKKSCQWANKIISVSENTKKDLVNLYGVAEEKINVIYEGYGKSNQQSVTSNQNNLSLNYELLVTSYTPFFLFIGRIEKRKNISNVVKAFELFKRKYGTDHRLVLAGRPGYGYENIKSEITNSKFKEDIVELGYIAEEEKWNLLKKADAFIFATLYEGFGIPILEAQSAGCPVIASGNSSIPEVAGSALLVDSSNIDEIAEKMEQLIVDQEFKNEIIKKGLENVKRFSWKKCAEQLAKEIIR